MSKFLNERYRKLESYTPGEQPKDTVLDQAEYQRVALSAGTGSVFAAINSRETGNLRLYPDPECGV